MSHINKQAVVAAAVRVLTDEARTPQFTEGVLTLAAFMLGFGPNASPTDVLRAIIVPDTPIKARSDSQGRTVKYAEAPKAAKRWTRDDTSRAQNMPARSFDAMRTVACPSCGAQVEELCVTTSGTPRYDDVHAGRHRAFMQWIADGAVKDAERARKASNHKPTLYHSRNVSCPTCKARAGQPCFEMTGRGPYAKPTTRPKGPGKYHRARYARAQKMNEAFVHEKESHATNTQPEELGLTDQAAPAASDRPSGHDDRDHVPPVL